MPDELRTWIVPAATEDEWDELDKLLNVVLDLPGEYWPILRQIAERMIRLEEQIASRSVR